MLERRLARLFHRAILVALATPAAAPLACSSGGSTGNAGSSGAGAANAGPSSTSSTNAASTGTSSTGSASSSGASTTSTGGGSATSSGAGGSDAGAPADAGEDCAPYAFTPNPPDTCGDYVRLPCGLPAGVTPGSNCYLFLSDCSKLCPTNTFFNCHAVNESCNDAGEIVNDPAGGVDLDCSICANGVGRIPAGLAPARVPRGASALGTYFAAVAHLEAASVHAFRQLGAELRVHGAPARLVHAARRARRDEVRHARLTNGMARRFGGRPVPPRVETTAPRALDAVAIENAMEGCVGETFGALVASFQARNAADPGIARLMETIARDETRHAALSWSVARWASRRLDAEARARLAERRREAVRALRREADACIDGELRRRAGLPTAAQQHALLDALEEQLWARAPSSHLPDT